mmetsp:Transcript_39074/g.51111  ORF Transcript_39074/g.51111 Transcript_39074/m.51111 type:complete len:105 (+) Transcript_39074:1231-1545(+)
MHLGVLADERLGLHLRLVVHACAAHLSRFERVDKQEARAVEDVLHHREHSHDLALAQLQVVHLGVSILAIELGLEGLLGRLASEIRVAILASCASALLAETLQL